MTRRTEAAPVLRVCSCLAADLDLSTKVREALTHRFGPIELASEPFDFDTSDYYRQEMGERLRRTWFCFRELCRPERLADERLLTARIEGEFAIAGRRRVNLDPGYLDLGKLVLASLKEAPDKIYLGQGVWAHTCLHFRFGRFTAPDHSFPDFRDGRFDAFMLEARDLYRHLLRASSDQWAWPSGRLTEAKNTLE